MKKLVAILAIMAILVSLLPGCTNGPEKQLKEMGYEMTNQDFLESVQKDDIKAVSLFLVAKLSPDTRNEAGLTALMIAAEAGHLDIARVLIDSKADVDAVSSEDGLSPLHFATFKGNVEIAELLLEKGVSLEPEWFETREAAEVFYAAVEAGRVHDARWYIRQGVNPDNDYCYPPALFVAVRNEDSKMVLMLLDEGADIEGRSEYADTTPLKVAAWKGLVEMAELLVTNGADVNHSTIYVTPPIITAALYNQVAMVDFLLSKGADINSQGSYGETPLIWAAHKGYTELVQLLLSKGADVTATLYFDWFLCGETRNYTALDIAEANGHTEIIKLLKSAAAK